MLTRKRAFHSRKSNTVALSLILQCVAYGTPVFKIRACAVTPDRVGLWPPPAKRITKGPVRRPRLLTGRSSGPLNDDRIGPVQLSDCKICLYFCQFFPQPSHYSFATKHGSTLRGPDREDESSGFCGRGLPSGFPQFPLHALLTQSQSRPVSVKQGRSSASFA